MILSCPLVQTESQHLSTEGPAILQDSRGLEAFGVLVVSVHSGGVFTSGGRIDFLGLCR